MKRFGLVVLCSAMGLASAQGQTADEKKATIAFLRGLQTADGGFLPAPAPAERKTDRSSLRATSAALRGLKYFGGTVRDREACTRFVQGCFDQTSGGFGDHPSAKEKPEVILTAVGLMAVVELKMPLEPYLAGAVRYLEEHAQAFEDIRMAAAGFETIGKRPARAEQWIEQLTKMRGPNGWFGQGDGAARATGGTVAALLRLGAKL